MNDEQLSCADEDEITQRLIEDNKEKEQILKELEEIEQNAE